MARAAPNPLSAGPCERRRAARTALSGQQGLSAQCVETRHYCRRLRAQPQTAGHWNTSIAICCTGRASIRSRTPLAAFELLKAQEDSRLGRIEFDVADMRALLAPAWRRHQSRCSTAFPDAASSSRCCRGSGACPDHGVFTRRAGATAGFAQTEGHRARRRCLASAAGGTWLMKQPDVIVIPKTTHVARLDENLRALVAARPVNAESAGCGISRRQRGVRWKCSKVSSAVA